MSTQDTFSAALGFTPEDLEANRSGNLTDSQRELMHSLRRRELLSNIFIGPLFLMIPVAVIIGGAYIVLRSAFAGMEWIWLLLLGGLIVNFVRFLPSGLRRWRAVGADIENGAASVNGRASIKSIKYRRATVYTLKIGDVSFDVPETITQVFQQGQVYRAYYTPQALILLSAEKL